MRRSAFLLSTALLLSHFAPAQLELPVRLELNGAAGPDRQVLGLAAPSQPDAAVSADATRRHVLTTATTTGSTVLIGELQPSPGEVVAGMQVTIIPQNANSAGASLDLNGTGPYPLVKWGSVPVDSADLPVGMPSRLVFDGARYQVLNWNSRPCTTGTIPGSALFCIDDSTRGTSSYYDAVGYCTNRGGRLCTFGEWASACRRNPGFLGTVASYEWVEDAANNSNDGKVVGRGYNGPDFMDGRIACEYGFTREPLMRHYYRCCYDR